MRSGFILLAFTLLPLFARAPEEASPQGVIRITVNLVQVDAVVTDSKGHQVTNLRPEDFEILEDGRPQTITNFSYISVTAPTPEETHAQPPPRSKGVPRSLSEIRLLKSYLFPTLGLLSRMLGL